MYRSERGEGIDAQKTVGKIREAFLVIFALGLTLLTLSLMASEVDAAQLGLLDRDVDRSGIDDRGNFQGPRNAARYLIANEQTAQTNGSRRQEKKQSVPEDRSTEVQQPAGPVGVAPESKKEILPSWMVRTFDLPGAGVLTPKGTLIVEPYLQFAHLSSSRVTLTGFTIVPAITVGLINIQGVSRDIYTAALVGRYGLTNRLEVEVRLPYLYREDSITQRPIATPSQADTLSTFSGSGLGDVETTGRFQLNQGGPDKPYFVGFARFKSISGTGPFEVPTDPLTGVQTELPTGSGFYIFQPGLTMLYPSDPVVLFSSVSFIYNVPRDVGNGIGRVDPGSGGNANLGIGLSLNEKLSLTLGYDHTIFSKPTSASNLLLTTAPQVTHIGVLLIGGSYRWSDRSFINFVVGVGATREAPDLQVTLRVPTALPLGKWLSRLTSSEGNANTSTPSQ
ncbi:MAG: hypothetical protein OEU68_12435 [Nitrospira sp.]|nr:hypothetical protein [Nitrospira sp.]MDH4244320.1 hypothetical protein [Nitrospira sp.]MDH4357873.1 hypothetical protein [Nitrospira sp.]MDH5318276.1 hypothetical protein [Nitrospira sp.]